MTHHGLATRVAAFATAAMLMVPPVGTAQDVPPPAIAAVVQYFAVKHNASIALALDGFADRAAAREGVRGMRVATGLESELVSCNASTRSCRKITSSDKIVRLLGVERSGGGLVLSIMITTPRTENGVGKVSRQVRILTLVRRLDRWEVTSDEQGVTG